MPSSLVTLAVVAMAAAAASYNFGNGYDFYNNPFGRPTSDAPYSGPPASRNSWLNGYNRGPAAPPYAQPNSANQVQRPPPQVPLNIQGDSVLEEYAGWNLLNFAGIDSRSWPQANGVITGLVITRDKFFMSVPRSRDGSPVTLSWLPRTDYPVVNQALIPFPDISWQDGRRDNCSGLVSVFRSAVDSCGRLWALDSGVVSALDGNPMRVCPPRMVAFDTDTGVAVRSVVFPDSVLRDRSLLTTIELDEYQGSCDHMFIYVSDTARPGMIVYDVAQDVAWRFEDDSFRPDQSLATYTIAGESFTLADGIIGMTISNLGAERMLYYQPLASRTIFAVPTEALKNPRTQRLPVITIGEKTSQGAGLIADAQGEIYFSPLTETAVASWNPNTGLQRILAVDEERIQFVSDFVLDPIDGSIWFITNKFQAYFQRTWNPNNINIRILHIPLDKNGYQNGGYQNGGYQNAGYQNAGYQLTTTYNPYVPKRIIRRDTTNSTITN